ncbi:hypothetical protein [Micromonospora sp. KC213]|uniref:hypothetical protein n=1 Tax=Micromonospora sp. KC213 TaxID=2530378 RepID=UPI0010440796|nr:hypothetical protein [Micromonospora sp. KC213]TDC29977.1 hypothetical protein E1166_29410 [Micromonospora sp. KC213]
MTRIFVHTDSDGDRLDVEPSLSFADAVLIGTKTTDGDEAQVLLFRPDVDRLRAALAPYGAQREAPAETGNPAAILDYVDPVGDTLTVYTRSSESAPLGLTINAEVDDEVTVHLTPDGVTRLREALKPFDPAEKDAEPPAPAIEVGREYRLLPGAHCASNREAEPCFRDVTRVRVELADAGDGDVRVTVLDGGTHAGSEGWYVQRCFLAPLDEPAPLATDGAVDALRARLGTTTGAPLVEVTPADLGRLWALPAPDLDPRRVAAVREAWSILGGDEDGTCVDTDSLLAIADFLVEGAA